MVKYNNNYCLSHNAVTCDVSPSDQEVLEVGWGFHVPLFPTKFSLCPVFPKVFFIRVPCSLKYAFVPVFQVSFSVCSHVPPKMAMFPCSLKPLGGALM